MGQIQQPERQEYSPEGAIQSASDAMTVKNVLQHRIKSLEEHRDDTPIGLQGSLDNVLGNYRMVLRQVEETLWEAGRLELDDLQVFEP